MLLRKWIQVVLGLAVLVLVQPAFADRTIPEEYVPAIENAQTIGRALYSKDQAAWRATDVLADEGILERDERLLGWITVANGEGHDVIFLGQVGDDYLGLYGVFVDADGSVTKDNLTVWPDGRQLTEFQRYMFKARQLAAETDFLRCAPNYNTVVLSREDNVGKVLFDVYLLAATTDWDLVRLGGHHRVTISKDAKMVVESVSFSNSCIDMSTRSKGEDEVAALAVTHMLSDTPNEVQVFMSLQHDVVLYVMTMSNQLMWVVTGDDIALSGN